MADKVMIGVLALIFTCGPNAQFFVPYELEDSISFVQNSQSKVDQSLMQADEPKMLRSASNIISNKEPSSKRAKTQGTSSNIDNNENDNEMSLYSFLKGLDLTDLISEYFPHRDLKFFFTTNERLKVSINELKKTELKDFFVTIIRNENWSEGNSNKINISTLDIPKSYVASKEAEFKKCYSGANKEHAELLVLFAIAIRFFIEKSKANIPLYSRKKTLEESKSDFDKLKQTRGSALPIDSPLGMKASNYFMEEQRFNCPKDDISFSELEHDIRLIGKTNTYLKKEKNRCLEKQFGKHISEEYVPHQFKPATIKYLCNLIQDKTNHVVTKYLNLCGGWGDRLVGALATASITRYIETDPNTNLLPIINQIRDTYDPEHKIECHFYAKPMEDLSVEELNPNNIRNDLVSFSPPYFNKEKYPGPDQSHHRYKDISSWVYNFLYQCVHVSYKALEPKTGVLAINIANIISSKKRYKLLDCLKYYLDNDLSKYYEKLAEPLIYKTVQYKSKSKNVSEIILYRTKPYQPELFHMPENRLFKLDEQWIEQTCPKKNKDENDTNATIDSNNTNTQTSTMTMDKTYIIDEEIKDLTASIQKEEQRKEKYKQIVANSPLKNKEDIQNYLSQINSYKQLHEKFQYYLDCVIFLDNIDISISNKRQRIKALSQKTDMEIEKNSPPSRLCHS